MAVVNKVDTQRARLSETMLFLENVPYSAVDSYIDSHVTNLASARLFLKKLTKLVLYLVKELQ